MRRNLTILLKEIQKSNNLEEFSDFLFELLKWFGAKCCTITFEEFNQKYATLKHKCFEQNRVIKQRILITEASDLVEDLQLKSGFNHEKDKIFHVTLTKPEIPNAFIKIVWPIDWNSQNDYISLDLLDSILCIKLEQLQQRISLEKYKQMLSNSLDVTIMIENDELEYVSPRAYEATGYSREDFIANFNAKAILHPDDQDDIKEKLKIANEEVSKKSRREYRIKHKNGKYTWVEWVASRIYDDDGNLKRIVMNCRDITIKKQYEAELKDSRDFVSRIIDVMPDSIFVYDLKKHNYVFTNQRLFTQLGFSPEDFSADSQNFLEKIIHPDDLAKFQHLLNEIKRGEHNIYESEFRVLDKNSEIHWIYTRRTPFKRDEYGLVEQFVGVSYDITAKKLEEQKLHMTQKDLESALNAKDEFLSVISHEIRTPLNAIIGLSNILQQKILSNEQSEMLNVLRSSGENLMLIINDLLDFSKISAGKLQFEIVPFDLHKLINNTHASFGSLANEKDINLQLKIAKDVPVNIETDPIRLHQILNNLISNSLKFTERGTVKIELETNLLEEDDINLNISIHDTGIGIPKSQLESIFEPFKQASKQITRKYGGSGLGLAITKRLVENMDGKITVESSEKGSVFRVQLPVRVSYQNDSKNVTIKFEKSISKSNAVLKLLYVEDVASNRFLMHAFCNQWGFQLDTANNGYEAIDLISNRQYDLILLDIRMPELDGFQVVEKLEALNIVLPPIIALSADISDGTRIRITESIIVDFVRKPLQPDILLEKLLKYARKDHTPHVTDSESKILEELFNIYKNPNDLLEYLTTSRIEFQEMIGGMVMAFEENDFELFCLNSHKLIGPLGVYGRHDLIKLFATIKSNAARRDLFFSEEEFKTISSQFDLLMNELNQIISIVETKILEKTI